MKQNTHPTLNHVVFVDSSSNAEFVTLSTLRSDETREINGVKHFILPIEISSGSHPFFTGKEMFIDTAGRIDKFNALADRVKEAQATRKGKKVKRAAKQAKKEEEKESAQA